MLRREDLACLDRFEGFPGFYFRFGGPEQLTEWRSSEAPVASNNYTGRNPVRYQNPEYDAMISRLVTTIPKQERMQLLRDMIHLTTDQLIVMPLYHEPEPVLIRNRLVNAGGARGLSIQAWNAQDWVVR